MWSKSVPMALDASCRDGRVLWAAMNVRWELRDMPPSLDDGAFAFSCNMNKGRSKNKIIIQFELPSAARSLLCNRRTHCRFG